MEDAGLLRLAASGEVLTLFVHQSILELEIPENLPIDLPHLAL